MKEKIKIGLFGFGVVGQGLYKILADTNYIHADIGKICVKDKNKERPLPPEHFTFDRNDIINDPQIDLIVELISDAEEAYKIVSNALANGKHVVTANKKMVAENMESLYQLQQSGGGTLLYEASSCGSIPIIRNLEEYYDNEPLHGVSGIFNGSSNYIMTRIFNYGDSYDSALEQAQQKGFAEADPSLDVEGMDALYKLCIITAHSYGVMIKPEDVFYTGIQALADQDIQYAKSNGYKIKPLATVQKVNDHQIVPLIIPCLIKPEEDLSAVENEYNAVLVDGLFTDKQLLKGKGAGGYPTGAAVISDISAFIYHYKYEYKKYKNRAIHLSYNSDFQFQIYIRYNFNEKADRRLIEKFELTNIREEGVENNQKYIVGDVNLDKLVPLRDVIREQGIFLMATSSDLGLGKRTNKLKHSIENMAIQP